MGNIRTNERAVLGFICLTVAAVFVSCGCTRSTEVSEEPGKPSITPVLPPAPPAPRLPKNTDEMIAIYDALSPWEAEPDSLFMRQRPVLLIIICDDYGTTMPYLTVPSKVGMEVAETFAHCGYDVAILVGIPRNSSVRHHPTVGLVCQQIAKLNDQLQRRNEQEQTAGHLAKSVAPLKLLRRPGSFFDGPDLQRQIESWLAATFEGTLVRVRPDDAEPPRTGRKPEVWLVESRPPFGAVYVCGHGRVEGVGTLKRTVYCTPADDPAGETNAADERLSLEYVAELAATKYRAPLWMAADICRGPLLVKPHWPEPPDATTHIPVAGLRRIGNVESFSPESQQHISEIEDFRGRATRLPTLLSLPPERYATLMFPDKELKVVFDTPLKTLGHHLAALLQTKERDDGLSRYFSSFANDRDVGPAPTSLTLSTLFDKSEDSIRQNFRSMSPDRHPGPVDDLMVVASVVRGFAYQQIHVNLCASNLSVNPVHTGFTVPRDTTGRVVGDIVPIRREQLQFNQDFKAYFDFRTPADLPAGHDYNLVLHVAAEADNRSEGLKFVVGAYDDVGDLLTDDFEVYSQAHSFTSPVPCDGTQSFRIVSLDRLRDAPHRLQHLEIQAVPHPTTGAIVRSDDWPLNATLTLFGAYLVPTGATLKVISSEIRAQAAYRDQQSLLRQWWPTTTLVDAVDREDPVVKTVLNPKDDGSVALTVACSGGNKGKWGLVGTLYPRRYVNKSAKRLIMRVSGGASVSPEAEIVLCLYAGDRILAIEHAPLHDALHGLDIDLSESGVPDEIAILIDGTPSVTIEQLSFEDATGP